MQYDPFMKDNSFSVIVRSLCIVYGGSVMLWTELIILLGNSLVYVSSWTHAATLDITLSLSICCMVFTPCGEGITTIQYSSYAWCVQTRVMIMAYTSKCSSSFVWKINDSFLKCSS